MFYSHWYLRKNGRFGLVWLAATQSRVLSRRELIAVNVPATVSNILEHIPGNLSKDVNRPRRFSLYLSSQLMYGSVRVLQRQWEFLLGDLTTLLRRFHPEISSTTEIDLIIARPDPVTLESCVPVSIKDKCYDPFFGVIKEDMADIQALLDIWDGEYIRKEQLTLDKSSEPFKAELGSPHSVLDIQQIQIRDHLDTSASIEVPGEQDLPYLDADSLALIQAADQQVHISVEDLVTPAISRIFANGDHSQLATSEVPEPLAIHARPVEETPAVKTPRELPRTPQKPKRKPREERDGGRKRPRNLDAEEKDDSGSGSGQQMPADGENITGQQTSQTEQDQQRKDSAESEPQQQLMSPVLAKRTDNWLHVTSGLQLTPIPATPSPIRKRQPHKLVIDETLQLTRFELKQNAITSSDTCITMVLPSAQEKDLFKEPGSKAVSDSQVRNLWTRNCKFGLRVLESDRQPSDVSDISPLESPKINRRQYAADYETPAKRQRTESVVPLSGPASMEKGRDLSAVSSNEGKERSLSFIGQPSDDSGANISADQLHVSTHSEYERNPVELSLAPVLEEQEQLVNVSPVPLQIPAEIPPLNVTDHTQNASMDTTENVQNELLRRVCGESEEKGIWTTFRTICPPETSTRLIAIRLFQELCCQIGKGALQVRQEEPYGEIFIWQPNGDSS